MNKKLLAVAVVGALASPAAFAQNVTIYGGIDVGYQNASNYATGSVNHNFITSGGQLVRASNYVKYSRIGRAHV